MLVRALRDFIAPSIPDGTAGQTYKVSDAYGQHLVDLGIAVALKMEPEPEQTKAAPPAKKPAPVTSSSVPGQVSAPKTPKRRGRPPKKPSQ